MVCSHPVCGNWTRQPRGTDTAALLPSLHPEHFRFSLHPPWAPGPPPLALRLGTVAASASHCSVLISLPGTPLSLHTASSTRRLPGGTCSGWFLLTQPTSPLLCPTRHPASTLIQPGCPHHRPLSPWPLLSCPTLALFHRPPGPRVTSGWPLWARAEPGVSVWKPGLWATFRVFRSPQGPL